MRDEMVDALDALVTEYGEFSWRLKGERGFKGERRTDRELSVEIDPYLDGWRAVASASAVRTGERKPTPCAAMASLMLDGLHSSVLGCCSFEEKIELLSRERDDIQQHAWQVEQERDALRAQLDEAAGLEDEMERRDRVARGKYAALERDRDLVENAMREASDRAARNEDNLKAVLEREETLKATLREACDAKLALVAQDGARLRAALEQETARADRWQECAADLMAQVARLRAKAARQSQLLNGSSSTAGVRDAEG